LLVVPWLFHCYFLVVGWLLVAGCCLVVAWLLFGYSLASGCCLLAACLLSFLLACCLLAC